MEPLNVVLSCISLLGIILITPSICLDEPAPFVIIAYPELPSDYLDFKFDFDSQQTLDPFSKRTKDIVIRDCENLRNASVYTTYPDPEFEEYATVKKAAQLTAGYLRFERKGLKYESKTVRVGRSTNVDRVEIVNNLEAPVTDESHLDADKVQNDEKPANKITEANDEHPVSLFRCISFVYNQHLFLSYGFNDDFMYFFKNPRAGATSDEEVDIEFIGRIEPKPILDSGLRDINDVSKIFLHIVNNVSGTANAKPVEEDVLCTLNANQQFRLCSLVDSVRSPTVRTEKNFRNFSHRCTANKLISLKGKVKENEAKPSRYLIDSIYANIIPCFKEDFPLFYLTADPSDESAVFSLIGPVRIQIDSSGTSIVEEFLVPNGRYRNVSVLKHRATVY